MAEFVSIYRNDYLWPVPQAYFPRAKVPGCGFAAPCNNGPVGEKPPLGNCPRTDPIEHIETDGCLKKLLEKNPNLISVARKIPAPGVIRKYNLERLKSTYQADFDHLDDKAMATLPPPKLPCPLDDAAPKVECRVSKEGVCKPPPLSRAAILYELRRHERNNQDPCPKRISQKKRKPPEVPLFLRKPTPIWTSEYRETFGKTGAEIKHMMKTSKKRARQLKLKMLLMNECQKRELEETT